MQNPNSPSRDQKPEETAFDRTKSVRVELPWVPLSGRERSFLTQVVVRDRASAVKDAIELYMRCRAQPHFDVPLRGKLTVHIWRVLQAAYPHCLWEWWEWERVCHQFNRLAREFLEKAEVEQAVPSANGQAELQGPRKHDLQR